MQYSTQSCPQSPINGDQFDWSKGDINHNNLGWNLSLDDTQIGPDYSISHRSSGSDEHHTLSSYSSDSSYSLPTDISLDGTYKHSIKGEEIGRDRTAFRQIFDSPPRKRARPDFSDDEANVFNLCSSITIPCSPHSRSIKSSPNEVFSNPITPVESTQEIAYSMLVQDALASFQPKAATEQYTALEQEPESVNKINRIAHNAIERRYRNNMNDCLNDLKNAVPALKFARVKDSTTDDSSSHIDNGMEQQEELIDGVPVATKLNKATILCKATEYITHLKATLEQSESENQALQNLILQLPRGQEVVAYYHMQKQQFEIAERKRMTIERQTAFERRQREKREARCRSKLLRRDQMSANTSTSSSRESSSSSSSSPGQTFMALFLGITYFTTTTNDAHKAHNFSDAAHHTSSYMSSFPSFDFWHIVKIFFILMVMFSFTKAIANNAFRIRKCKNRPLLAREAACYCE